MKHMDNSTECADRMSNYDAVMLCEGVMEPRDEEHLIEAWQHLVDTGMAWSLQGWFGRTANALIEEGILKEATNV